MMMNHISWSESFDADLLQQSTDLWHRDGVTE